MKNCGPLTPIHPADFKDRHFVALFNNPGSSNNIPILLLVYLIFLLVFTLMPFTLSIDPSISFTRLLLERFENLSAIWSTHPREMFGNISLFIPFGFLLAALPGLSPCRLYTQILFAGVISFISSFAIELCQLFIQPRSPSMIDVFLNTAGGMIGALMAFFYHTPPHSTGLSILGTCSQKSVATKNIDPLRPCICRLFHAFLPYRL